MDLLKALNNQYMKEELPEVRIGDTVRVHVRIKEGSRERIQVFEGTVIARKNALVNKEDKIMDLVKALNSQYMKEEVPAVNVGDTVRVHVRIKEGSRERIQVFEGTVIARKHGGIAETITVRRISYGVGCEKVFPLHSPNVAMIETVRKGKVRRAKLYYLRDRFGKAAKVKEKV